MESLYSTFAYDHRSHGLVVRSITRNTNCRFLISPYLLEAMDIAQGTLFISVVCAPCGRTNERKHPRSEKQVVWRACACLPSPEQRNRTGDPKPRAPGVPPEGIIHGQQFCLALAAPGLPKQPRKQPIILRIDTQLVAFCAQAL